MNALEIISILKTHKVVPRLVGSQLKLVGETGSLPDELIERIREGKEELSAFLKAAMDQTAFTPIPVVDQQASYPASNAQRRIWLLSQLEGGSAAYIIVRSFYLKGAVSKTNLEKAFQRCIQRHESLRTLFKEINGELRQIVPDQLPFRLDFIDISSIDDGRDYLRSRVDQSATLPFDLEHGPLIRVRLFQMAAEEYAMIFSVHHIISDGWSINILVQEVMHSYEAFCKNEEWQLPPLKIQYKDYSQWHTGKIEGERGQQARHFWESQFSPAPEPLDLPADFPREAMRSFRGEVIRCYPGVALFGQVLSFCKDNQVTTFNFFRATLSLLLSKLSGQHDITIGTPVSGRSHLDLEGQIGLYVNTLPLRIIIDPALTFHDFLKQVSVHSFKTFEFQDYPFDKMVEDLEIRRDLSRNPLFDVMMVLQNPAIGEGSVNKQQQYGFELNLLEKYLYPSGRNNVEKVAAKFDWTINFDYEPDNTFYIEIEYDSRLFRKAGIQRHFQSYLHIIRQVLEGPDRYVSAIGLVTPAEEQQILHEFNAPVEPIEEFSILQLLAPSFLQRQEETAIIVKDKRFSYRQLDAASDNIANFLRGLPARGDSPFVGLLMLRSEKTLSCILGVLKAGLAYVPIDSHYPPSRIKYIIEDAGLTCILADDQGLSLIPPDYKGRVIPIKDIDLSGSHSPLTGRVWENKDLRENTAYLIYTSGSTGKPKGVEICHRNVIAFLKWAHQEYAGTSFDILYAATSYCFDLSVFEFLFPLMEGKTIRMLDSATDITRTTEWIGGADKNIMLNTVPSVIRSLLEEGMDWSTVSAINIAGEPVPESFKRSLDFSAIGIRNLYGPSEDTTYSTVYRFAADDYPAIPIGSPVGYSQLYIMDADRNLLPVGVDGEIYLSGQSVAKGYLNQPVLTAERFLANPFLPGLTMYKTGDLGRWTEDGKVLFTGRIDDQVKIRGYRIEPGEIQFQLEQHEGVDQAVVLVQEVNGDQGIVAYIKGDPVVSPSLLKTWLSDRLPAYMIPGWWIQLEDIPLNSNGKVDRKQLPLPLMSPGQPTECIPPETGLQHRLLSLWKRVLGVEELGITDNFFDKGGHSLKATKLRFLIVSELGKDITLNELFSFATIERQAQLLESRSSTPVIKIPESTGLQEVPISLAQERLWVLTKFKDASVAYNMPAVFTIKGPLDAGRLQAAFNQVIRRYEILRTVFTEKEGRPVQSILAPEDLGFVLGCPAGGERLSTRETLERLKKEWRKPFDLEKGPLLQAGIIETEQAPLLYFNMHHLISDGWSLGILYEQVAAAYRSLTQDLGVQPEDPEIQYKDYAIWQRRQLTGDRLEVHRLFWQDVFKDGVPVLELPTDFHRPPVKTYNGATADFRFPPSVSRKLHQLARGADVSLFMTLMAAVNVLLKKYTGQNDIVIGTPVSGRDHPQLEDQIGFYVNTLPIRTEIDPNDPFLSLLTVEKNNILRAFEHQAFPFEMLVEILSLKRELSRSPLFDVMLVLQDGEEWAGGYDNYRDLQLQRLPAETGVAKYDLLFSFLERKEVLELSLEYNTDLFREETILRMIRHLHRLFDQVTASPEKKIKDIMLVDETEVATLISKADQSRVSYDKTATILSLFRQTVVRYGDKTALVTGQTCLTYRELDTKSGQLAKILIEDYKISSGELVILCFGRNEWMLIAIFAVLKAGAAYVPVDPDYPSARTAYMLEDTASRLILTDHSPGESLKRLQVDRDPNLHRDLVDITNLVYAGPVLGVAVQPSDLAYVIYTSGTTGTPKGVLIEHRQVTRLLFTEDSLFDFGPDDRWSLFHSYCFDFSVWEMYGALLNGATLVIVPKETAQNGHVFYDFLQKEKITILNQTPTAFRSMLQASEARFSASSALSVRYLIFGGEALMPGILAPWKKALPACRIVNMYGITETTVHVTYKEITEAELAGNQSNIGFPIPTMSCYVLDADLRQVPIGVTGELCVGGAGVGRGYLNKPALTADRFIGNPFIKDQRMYRSGDHARILSNGDMEYLGRRDDQVKIRGHRIELAEVETALLHRQEIKDAVVIPLKNAADEYELAAWFIPSELFEDQTRLRRHLMELLPAYMIPSFLIPLAQFPLNSNGKLDKDRLPGPDESGADPPVDYVPFRHDTDKKILEIWEEILEKQGIGIRDNFFDLGGHSLKATRVVSRIHEVFGIGIDLKTLFIEPTVEHLSNYIETIQWMEDKQFTMAEDENEIIF